MNTVRAARSPAGTGQERDYEMFEDGDMWPSSRPGSAPDAATEWVNFGRDIWRGSHFFASANSKRDANKIVSFLREGQ